jgi:hypothetical protein
MRFSDRIRTLALCSALASACSGQIGKPAGGGSGTTAANGGSSGGTPSGTGIGSSGGTGIGSSGGGAGSGVTAPPSLLTLPASPLPTTGLHKLTAWEFANSVQDLLGRGVPLSPVEADTLIGGFATVGASSVSISPAGVGQYETVLGTATAYAFADATRASSILSCMPQATTDTACLTQALNTFGRRAFRRPLTSAETALFLNLATTIGSQSGSSVLIGIRYAVLAILESPDFLYRVELGAPSAADGGRLKYTSFEIASRLAATLWASVPDDVLLDAAAKDALSTPAGNLAQAQRMLADPRVHRSLAAFVDQLFEAFSLSQSDKNAAMYPAFTPTLRAAMLQEVELRIDDMAFSQKGDYLSLFDSRSTFVNKELATFYGVPFTATDTGFHRVDFPADSPRVGLLGSGAVLAGHGHEQLTSPTHRGKFVDEMLLCRIIPPPPPGVPPLPSMAPPNSTVRQILATHRSAAQCSACHAFMDPIGLGMEAFDTTGQYRTTDNGQPIDSSGMLDGVAFSSLAELGTAVRNNAVAGPCLVSKVYENALGRLPVGLDRAALDQLIDQFVKNGNRVDQLLVNLVGNDGFRFVAPM